MVFVFLRHVGSLFGAFWIAQYIVPILMRAASRLNFFDIPDSHLKKHERSTPYLGGLAVYYAFIASLSLFSFFGTRVLWLIFGTTMLLFIGLIDDCKVLSPAQKFGGQIIAVICLLRGGFMLKVAFFSSVVNTGASALWMLSVINAVNLTDVMDGLAATISIISASFFAIIAIFLGDFTISILTCAFIGAVLGFFIYNKPPAKIYLGDAGALCIGGILAAMPLLFSWSERQPYGFITPAIILGVPLLEVASLIVIRTIHGIPFYRGSPHHFCHFLRRKNWNDHQILVTVASFGSFLGVVGSGLVFGVFSLTAVTILLLLGFATWALIIFSPLWRIEKVTKLSSGFEGASTPPRILEASGRESRGS
ncbi:undecaprenyl/decaprenyl-phosphate alpha-N-acetylglucosaminyl 1-phosphate transferase [bacterium]|nr:undecaprenyl/decaprenyl-phosphate alpha-N-acetylglucosaminyl 1-phosphate transferase [bacterium]